METIDEGSVDAKSCMIKAMDVERQVLAEYKAELEQMAKKLAEREQCIHQKEQEIRQQKSMLQSQACVNLISAALHRQSSS